MGPIYSETMSFLFGAFGGTAAAVASVKLLSKWFIEHQLTKALKEHEAHLTERADVLKTQLGIFAHEQNVAVSRVDAQRAQAIHAIYAAIRSWVTPVTKIINESPLRNVDNVEHVNFYANLCEMAHKASITFHKALADNAIYIDAELYEELGALARTCGMSVAEVLVPIRQGRAEDWPIDVILEKTEEERKNLIATYEASIEPALRRITMRFRKELGIAPNP